MKTKVPHDTKLTTRQRTSDTTKRILAFFCSAGAFAKRINVLGVPLLRDGVQAGFRPSTMVGFPDIMAVLPVVYGGVRRGLFVAVEVKTGKDRLRPEQEGVHSQIRKVGGVVFVVKDYEDFLIQWQASELPQLMAQ